MVPLGSFTHAGECPPAQEGPSLSPCSSQAVGSFQPPGEASPRWWVSLRALGAGQELRPELLAEPLAAGPSWHVPSASGDGLRWLQVPRPAGQGRPRLPAAGSVTPRALLLCPGLAALLPALGRTLTALLGRCRLEKSSQVRTVSSSNLFFKGSRFRYR